MDGKWRRRKQLKKTGSKIMRTWPKFGLPNIPMVEVNIFYKNIWRLRRHTAHVSLLGVLLAIRHRRQGPRETVDMPPWRTILEKLYHAFMCVLGRKIFLLVYASNDVESSENKEKRRWSKATSNTLRFSHVHKTISSWW